MVNDRLKRQMDFLLETDKMKSIYRQSYIIRDEKRSESMPDAKEDEAFHRRRENDAEHSFHLALFAMILSEHAGVPIDLLKVMKMVIVHDIVEIDAGDTYCYDKKGYESKREREEAAAERIFGLLPDDQCVQCRALWEEFEACETAESRFANSLDRIQPMLLNYSKGGVSWQEHGISYTQVRERNNRIADGSETLWEYAENMIKDALDKGYLKNQPGGDKV